MSPLLERWTRPNNPAKKLTSLGDERKDPIRPHLGELKRLQTSPLLEGQIRPNIPSEKPIRLNDRWKDLFRLHRETKRLQVPSPSEGLTRPINPTQEFDPSYCQITECDLILKVVGRFQFVESKRSHDIQIDYRDSRSQPSLWLDGGSKHVTSVKKQR